MLMKKIFTLIGVALMAISSNAQTLINYPTSKDGITLKTTDTDQICYGTTKINTNTNTVDGIKFGKTFKYAEAEEYYYATLSTEGGFKAGDVITITGVYNNAEEKNSAIKFYSDPAGEPIWTTGNFINGRTAEEDPVAQTFTLTADAATLYFGRQGNTGTFVLVLTVTRGGGSGEGGGGGDTGLEETYSALSETNGLGAAYAAVVDANNIATNVVNGNSIVKFGTANVEVEAVGSADPADKPEGGQDITIGAQISAEEHTYELVSINSTKPIKWEVGNRGDISYYYIKGTGTPAVSMVAEEVYTEGEPTGKYRVKVTAFDPTAGGEPTSGLYYKFTTKVDGALKVGIWANKGNRTTFLVDGETKKVSDYIVEGYLEGETDTEGKLKWLTNDEIVAIHDAAGTATYVIGNGKNFWGNAIIDAKAGKTYWLFQGNSQIGFQGYTFVPGAKKEDITKIESIQTKTNNVWNADAPMYNLSGQKVDKSYKGIVIQNGRKFVNK